MFGNLGKMPELMSMLANPEKAGEAIRGKIPAILEKITGILAKQCDARDSDTIGIMYFDGHTATGNMLMARVLKVDQFGEIGEELGCVVVEEALKSVDPLEIMDFFN